MMHGEKKRKNHIAHLHPSIHPSTLLVFRDADSQPPPHPPPTPPPRSYPTAILGDGSRGWFFGFPQPWKDAGREGGTSPAPPAPVCSVLR